ncbi:MAG: aldolase [bacterium]
MKQKIVIPLTVPKTKQALYKKNYMLATQETGNLFLFAGDQKIEHLNANFRISGTQTFIEPEYLFEIASKARIGVFAAQMGLISRYADKYRNVNYLVKINSKSNILPANIQDPLSAQLNSVQQVVDFKKSSGLSIVGVGFTLYLGSEYEASMMEQASQAIIEAHKHGLIAVLWIYPRGQAVASELDENIIAGAAGVATTLGADFVKVNPPKAHNNLESAKKLIQATTAAGNTGVVCSGGSLKNTEQFLEELYNQINTGKTRGAAIGRNIYQKHLPEALAFCTAAAAIIFDSENYETAKKLLKK